MSAVRFRPWALERHVFASCSLLPKQLVAMPYERDDRERERAARALRLSPAASRVAPILRGRSLGAMAQPHRRTIGGRDFFQGLR